MLIDSLPQGKLSASNYRLAESEIRRRPLAKCWSKQRRLPLLRALGRACRVAPATLVRMTAGVVMNSTGVGEVVESTVAEYAVGDAVVAPTGWQTLSPHEARHRPKSILPTPSTLPWAARCEWPTAVLWPCNGGSQRPVRQLVSAAAGSVGHLVGQMARLNGCRVVGVMGSDAKQVLVDQLGFDVAELQDANYRQTLKEATANGVDVYFDNTGGMILSPALFRMNVGGRIACCGVVSQYDTDSPEPGPRGILDCWLITASPCAGFWSSTRATLR